MKKKRSHPFLTVIIIVFSVTLLYGVFYALPHYKMIEQAKLDSIAQSLSLESKLVLLEQTYRNVIYVENSQKLFNFKVPTNRLLFSVDYKMRAGINLEKSFMLVNKSKNSLLVRYPEPEIFSIDAQDETITLYNNWNLIGTSIKQSDFLPALVAEQDHVAQKAMLNDYKKIVNTNAEAFFTAYFLALGYQSVTFEVIKS